MYDFSKKAVLPLAVLSFLSMIFLGVQSWVAIVPGIFCGLACAFLSIKNGKDLILKLMDKWYWDRLKVYYHVSVAFLAIIPARWATSFHLELPPQFFTLTVSLGVVLFYIPVWLAALSFLVIIYIVFQFLKLLAENIIGMPVLIDIVGLLRSRGRNGQRLSVDGEKGDGDDPGVLLIGGMLALMFFVALSLITFSIAVRQKWLFENMAYYVDFQEIKKYPCIPADERTLLLDNGLYAKASRDKYGYVTIDVEKINGKCLDYYK